MSEAMAKTVGPREQLMLRGEAALSDAELLAVLLGTGTATEPVGVVAQKLLVQGGGLRGLARAGIAMLSECPGVGPTKACRLRAALELGLRASVEPLDPHRPIRSSADVVAVLAPRLRDETREHFYALALDVRHRPVAELLIAVGGLTACSVAPADVFRRVLREPAAAVVFAHNHPSGDPSPSPEDAALTTRLQQAGSLLGVQVLDHVIIGRNTHFSFLDQGLLRPPDTSSPAVSETSSTSTPFDFSTCRTNSTPFSPASSRPTAPQRAEGEPGAKRRRGAKSLGAPPALPKSRASRGVRAPRPTGGLAPPTLEPNG